MYFKKSFMNVSQGLPHAQDNSGYFEFVFQTQVDSG